MTPERLNIVQSVLNTFENDDIKDDSPASWTAG